MNDVDVIGKAGVVIGNNGTVDMIDVKASTVVEVVVDATVFLFDDDVFGSRYRSVIQKIKN